MKKGAEERLEGGAPYKKRYSLRGRGKSAENTEKKRLDSKGGGQLCSLILFNER